MSQARATRRYVDGMAMQISGPGRAQWLADAVRCPACRGPLTATLDACADCGQAYARARGLPVLIAGADPEAVIQDEGGPLPTYDCAGLGIREIDEALERGDRMLELGAGLDCTAAPNVVRTDANIYGDAALLDVVADAHRLPFDDATFDFVFSLAVFEHLHSPWLAAQEIARVLRPGGRVYTLCAFMQSLHGYPSHYFNATEFGLAHLFAEDLEIVRAGPSPHCPYRQTVEPMLRIREMARTLRDERSASWRSRWRARRLDRALMTAGHQYQQLADEMLESDVARAAWRKIAPAVELVALKPGDARTG